MAIETKADSNLPHVFFKLKSTNTLASSPVQSLGNLNYLVPWFRLRCFRKVFILSKKTTMCLIYRVISSPIVSSAGTQKIFCAYPKILCHAVPWQSQAFHES